MRGSEWIMKEFKSFLPGDWLGGIRRVGEVMLGCVVGLVITWFMSKVWPPTEPDIVKPK